MATGFEQNNSIRPLAINNIPCFSSLSLQKISKEGGYSLSENNQFLQCKIMQAQHKFWGGFGHMTTNHLKSR